MNHGASTSEAIPLTVNEYCLEFLALNPAIHIQKTYSISQHFCGLVA